VEFNNDNILHVNVYNKKKKISSSSTNLSESSIKKIINSSIDMSKYTSSDQFCGLPEKDLLICKKDLNLSLLKNNQITVKEAIRLAVEAEIHSLSYDKRIIISEGVNFCYHISIKGIGNSLGIIKSYPSSMYSISHGVIAANKKGMQRDFAFSINRNFDKLKSSEWIGKTASKRTISRLSPQKIKTTVMPVILSSDISYSLFEHLSEAISGKNITQKSSFLLNSMEKKVLPSWCSIIENPHIYGGLASRPFDSEGITTKIKTIVDQGILKTWLLDSYSAKKLKLRSTANSGNMHNWIIKTNFKQPSFTSLLKTMNTGLLIVELLGHGINIVNGDYSIGAFGFFVKNGEVTYPVDEITISGNLKEILRNIQSISNDVNENYPISCGSILLSSINISGK